MKEFIQNGILSALQYVQIFGVLLKNDCLVNFGVKASLALYKWWGI